MALPLIRRSKLSLSDKARIRKEVINSPKFDISNVGLSGPIMLVQSCGHTNNNYRTGYSTVKWN